MLGLIWVLGRRIVGQVVRRKVAVHIRVASLDDAEAVTSLLGRAYPAMMASTYEADVLAAALPTMTQANPRLLASGTYYVAEGGGRLLGCGGWTSEGPGSAEVTRGLGHLRHFATDPDMARRGVGRAILKRCVAEAERQGITRFQAFAGLNAKGFYQTMGLRVLELVHVPMGPVRFPAVLMEGLLTADDAS